MIACSPDSHDDARAILVPRWAFRLMVGFFYLSLLCGVLTVVLLFVMVAKIRQTQVNSADRLERAVEEVARDGRSRQYLGDRE